MTITLLQRDIHWCAPELNRREIEETLKKHSGTTDLYLLPEMFTTGFCMSPKKTAEEAQCSETIAWMKQMASQYQCALAGSIAIADNGNFYNRLYFVYPDETVRSYDKRHLFTYGGEDAVYTAGNNRTVLEYKSVRILLQICYDLRFPVWTRNNGDYDLILYVANWPTSRIMVWDTLLCARALENQCYVAGVNRIGSDPLCDYCGHSRAIDAYGKDIVYLGESENTASFSIDLNKLQTFRAKFPVLNDRDQFSIHLTTTA